MTYPDTILFLTLQLLFCRSSELFVDIIWILCCFKYQRLNSVWSGEPLGEVDCLSTWGRKWQLMEDVKGCGTQNERLDIERWKVCWAIEDWGWKGQEVSIWRSNYTNRVVRSRGMGYENRWEKESECSWDEVFEKFGWRVSNGWS